MDNFSFEEMMFQEELSQIQHNTQIIQRTLETDPYQSMNEILERLKNIELTQQQILNHLQLTPITVNQQSNQLQNNKQIKLWSEEDKEKFVQALTKTQKSNITFIQQHYLPEKSHKQIISYSQKFFQRLKKCLLMTSIENNLDEVKLLTKTSQMFQTLKVTMADNVIQFANNQFKRNYVVVNCPCGMLCRMNDTFQCDIQFLATEAVALIRSMNIQHSLVEIFTMFGNVLLNSNYNILFTIKFLSEQISIPQNLLFLLLFIYFANHPRRTIMIKDGCTCGNRGTNGQKCCSCKRKELTLTEGIQNEVDDHNFDI